MWGLIIKDLLNLKKQGAFVGIFALVYMAISVINGDAAFFIGVVMILGAMMPITALSFDERAKWDRYALSMPVSRRDLVVGKYILGLLLMAAVLVLCLAFSLAIGTGSVEEQLLAPLIMGGVGVALLCIMMPILFKFGVEKARIALLLICAAPAAAIVSFVKISGIDGMPENLPGPEMLALLMVLAIIVLFVVSLMISLRIYAKKEF